MDNTQQQLLTAPGSGSQNATQDPQSSPQALGLAAQTDTVQTGAPTSLLVSQNGILLHSALVPTVNLDASATTTSTTTVQATHHGPNPTLLGFAGLLFLIAIVLFWSTSRSAKTTTKSL